MAKKISKEQCMKVEELLTVDDYYPSEKVIRKSQWDRRRNRKD